MKIIEKIEIKNFRSFVGTTQKDKAEIIDVRDLNIFSGSNDSGKSNVLRALNLFFNGEIDTNHQFNFDTEFSMLRKNIVQKVIEIKVYFRINNRPFSISKFYNRDGYRNFEYRFIERGEEVIIDSRPSFNEKRYGDEGKTPDEIIYDKEQGYRRYAQRLIYWTSFSYVPAIRDERFFSHLYGKIILQIKTEEDRKLDLLTEERRKILNYERTLSNTSENKILLENLRNEEWRESRVAQINDEVAAKSSLKKSISELEGQINDFTKNLFSSANFLTSEFRVGNNLKDFFESFDIGTGNEKEISLRLRGDGIQAKFIPEMLNFLDSIQESKKHFIWGFEEPENSAEYKNQRELAEKFKDKFLENKQIFLTTHSEEFLSLYDGREIEKDKRKANLYHVKKISNKEINDFSVIELFDVETQSFEFATVKTDIEKEIGSSLIRAKYSKELKDKEDIFLEEKRKLEIEKSEIEESFKQQIIKLNHNFPPNIFICEDKNGIDIWQKFFKEFDLNNIKIMSSRGCTTNRVEIWINGAKLQNETYNPKVYRSLDRDGYTAEQVAEVESELKDINGTKLGILNYSVKFLPVNELENFAIICDDFFTNELINANKAKLEDHFSQTIGANIDRNNNKFKTDLFKYSHKYEIANQMRREAVTDMKKYFPGKEIKKLKDNFDVDEFLLNLRVEDYPAELVEYLNEIKLFFS